MMLGRVRFAAMIVLCAATAAAAPPKSKLSDEDLKLVASQTLQWALEGGLPWAQALAPTQPVYVSSHNLPSGIKLEVKDRTVSMGSFVRMQGLADIGGELVVFSFDRAFLRDGRAIVTVNLNWLAPSKNSPTPRPAQGATIEFLAHEGGWTFDRVTARWPQQPATD